jgi:hypothetical protein
MSDCAHEDVTLDLDTSAGHQIWCNGCGRRWRYHMEWPAAWEHFISWERRGEKSNHPETVRVDCS